jgi:hypothetical protein
MVCFSTGPDIPSTDPECLISGAFFVAREEAKFCKLLDRPDDLLPLGRSQERWEGEIPTLARVSDSEFPQSH